MKDQFVVTGLPRVTFILPSMGRYGGVRVTVDMANGLIDAGVRARIVCVEEAFSSWRTLKTVAQRAAARLRGMHADWSTDYRGELKMIGSDLNACPFEDGEVVIAVGMMTVPYIDRLSANVVKVRYCHGFTGGEPEQMAYAWGIPMKTIAVAPGLAEELEKFDGGKVLAIVPNGINASQYFPESDVKRDGVGTVFSRHPNKNHEDANTVFDRLKRERPEVARYAFGPGKGPSEENDVEYQRLPSVEAARKLYSRSKVWFVTSRYEGFCLPMLEAMACGSCVVTTHHDGCDGLIEHGTNGFVVPYGAIDEMCGHIEALLEDQELRSRICAVGYQTVEKFSWDKAVKSMVEFLRTV